MQFVFRGTVFAIAGAAVCLGAGAARAGDDGAAPLWEGIGSIVSPLVGFGGKEEKPPIDYREHGKLVVPKSMDLPQPDAGAAAGGDWPVDQEVLRKKVAKQKEKDKIAGVGDARLRYTHPFPNAPVTVGASDPADQTGGKPEASSPLGNLNPLGWVGLGKSSTALGPEPDREWLTDPPKGYRAPAATAATPAPRPAAGQASN
jgi:hypothetical protein